MTQLEFLITKLFENERGTMPEIADLFFEEYPEKLEQKTIEYGTEAKARKQMAAQFGGYWKTNSNFFNRDASTKPLTWSLSEEGAAKYNSFDEEPISEKEVDEILEEEKIDANENFDGIGDVYFATTIYPDTIKIGEGITYQNRMITLNVDKFYGFFKPQMKYFLRIKNYKKVEKTLHGFFDNFRINQGRELFRNVNENEFLNFIRENYIKNERFKNDIIEHNIPLA